MGAHSVPAGPAGRARRRELAEARRRQLGPGLIFLSWILYGLQAVRTGISDRATTGYYLVALLIFVLLLIPAIAAVIVSGRWSARVAARPRWHYVAFAVGYLIPVLLAGVEFTGRPGHLPAWWANSSVEQPVTELATLVLVWSAILAVVMTGRAVAWGRLRRRFWLNPPAWVAGVRINSSQ